MGEASDIPVRSWWAGMWKTLECPGCFCAVVRLHWTTHCGLLMPSLCRNQAIIHFLSLTSTGKNFEICWNYVSTVGKNFFHKDILVQFGVLQFTDAGCTEIQSVPNTPAPSDTLWFLLHTPTLSCPPNPLVHHVLSVSDIQSLLHFALNSLTGYTGNSPGCSVRP